MIRGEMIYLHEAQLESIPDMHVVTGELMLNHVLVLLCFGKQQYANQTYGEKILSISPL
jgi:hypothetical protein